MHNPDDNAAKEKSSIFIFIPLALVGVYLVYLTATIPFRVGAEHGATEKLLSPPPAPDEVAEEKVYDHRKLMVPSEDLVTLGGKLFSTNCASCHGTTGYGDGTAGSKLAVKPRNFHAPLAEWKSGAATLTMYHTLEKGLGSMPAFPALDPEQKYAVIHYVHAEFMKEIAIPADTQAAIDALPQPGGAVAINIDPYKETRVPVDYAIRKMLAETDATNPGAM